MRADTALTDSRCRTLKQNGVHDSDGRNYRTPRRLTVTRPVIVNPVPTQLTCDYVAVRRLRKLAGMGLLGPARMLDPQPQR